MFRPFAAAIVVLLAVASPRPAVAAPAWPGTEASAPAIGGYDPVAYFGGAPALGYAAFTASFDGATFRFASAANRDAFAAAPARYAPQFGGHCAWAASQGRLATPDPTLWKIVEGKLYLNCSAAAEAKWLADVPGNIARGAAFWAAQK
jgi:YHS domain-containing protein